MNNKKDREYFEQLFQPYPDVVNTETFCKMLGIGISLAWRLLQANHVKSIHYLDQKYIIPKEWVIDYVIGEHYQGIKNRLKIRL